MNQIATQQFWDQVVFLHGKMGQMGAQQRIFALLVGPSFFKFCSPLQTQLTHYNIYKELLKMLILI